VTKHPDGQLDERLQHRAVPGQVDPRPVRNAYPHGDGSHEPRVVLDRVAQAGHDDHCGENGLDGEDAGELQLRQQQPQPGNADRAASDTDTDPPGKAEHSGQCGVLWPARRLAGVVAAEDQLARPAAPKIRVRQAASPHDRTPAQNQAETGQAG
jgi:hypothetical protein